jgi:UDP-N-acetylglucosamine 2-epimerase
MLKLAPVIAAFRAASDWSVRFVATAQHRDLLDQALQRFDLLPDVDLDLMRAAQTSIDFTSRALPAVAAQILEVPPDLVIVQGDTNTAVVGALAGFHLQVPVGHVEAGLRSHDLQNPYPEEANRRVISQVAGLHFAPTQTNRDNLIAEGVDPGVVVVTGNPIVDALNEVLAGLEANRAEGDDLRGSSDSRLVLVTLHRRETIGAALENICGALVDLVQTHDQVSIVWPVHPNPAVRKTVLDRCGDKARIRLIDPVGYLEFVKLMREADLIISDSGGVQEEAPTVGTPLLVVRDVTERPEVVECGAARLIGRSPDRLLAEATELLTDERAYSLMLNKENPYGDGSAAENIVAAATAFFENRH